MAVLRTPTNFQVHNIGSLKKVLATFSDIDDNDTVVYPKSGQSWDVHHSIDGPQDTSVDAYTRSTGTLTFSSEASATGRVNMFCKDY